MDDQRHFTAVADGFAQLRYTFRCRCRMIRLARALDPLIQISRIKCNNRDIIPCCQVELYLRGILVDACDRDHIRITRKLLIQDIDLLIHVFLTGRRIIEHLDLIAAAVSQRLV